MKKCPYCAELIQDEAIVCRYCGRDLIKPTPLAAPSPPTRPGGTAIWIARWIVIGVVALLCLLSGGIGTARLVKVNQIRSTEQTFHTQLTEASQHIYQQATETHVAKSVSSTATAAARTSLMNDPFDAILRLELGPVSGDLKHEDGVVNDWCPTLWLRDFVAEARFQNPYDASTNKFDYGFLFRHTKRANQYRITVTSKKRWSLTLWEDEYLGRQAEGDVTALRTGAGEFNTLRFIARGDTGYLYINEVLVSKMDLSARLLDGEICIATGITTDYKVEGYQTHYQDFRIWSMDASQ